MKEMVNACCVCSDERGWSENPLVYCDGAGCNIAVHQACYGIVAVPKGNWYCRKCELKDNSPFRCELCPFKGGAVKQTDNGKWAHVVCALYIPEVKFLNVTTMEPIVLTDIPKERFFKICYICDKSDKLVRSTVGACMQCNKPGCKQYFHVTCAQTLGLLCEEAGKHLNNISYCGYCEEHFTKLKKVNTKCLQSYESVSSQDEDSTIERGNSKFANKKKTSKSSTKLQHLVKKDTSHHNLNLIINLSSYPPTVSECSAKVVEEDDSSLSKFSAIVSDDSNSRSSFKLKKRKGKATESNKEEDASQNFELLNINNNEKLIDPKDAKDSSSLSLCSFSNSFSIVLSPQLQTSGEMMLPKEEHSIKVSKKSKKGSDRSHKMEEHVYNKSDKKKHRVKRRSHRISTDNPSILINNDSCNLNTVISSVNTITTNTYHVSAPSTSVLISGKNEVKDAQSGIVKSNPSSFEKNEKNDADGVESCTTKFCDALNTFTSNESSDTQLLGSNTTANENLTIDDSVSIFDSIRDNLKDVKKNVNSAGSKKNSNATFTNPQTSLLGNALSSALKELLEKQWDQASAFLMEQAEHLSIASKVSELHKVQAEIIQAEEYHKSLISRRDHLLAVNSRLSFPLAFYDAAQKTTPFLQKPLDSLQSPLYQLHQQHERYQQLNIDKEKVNKQQSSENTEGHDDAGHQRQT